MHRLRMLVAAACALATLVAVASAGAAKAPTGATGTVFFPNPVAQLQDQSLTDRKDADYPALAPAYTTVGLTDLDGSGYLVGAWANVLNETGGRAYAPDGQFHYRRDDGRFEQVMAYYWVTQAQRYLQSLGFGSNLRPVNHESQDIRVDQYGVDNSYSWDKHDVLRFGKGDVDDAEDAEVILHEYGHALMDSQQTPFGYGASAEAGAIGEGFGDYWAVTVAAVVAPTPDAPCVADWDSTGYTSGTPHCLRRTDRDLHYPEDLDLTRIHRSGQIWSRALWDIRNAVGATRADTLIVEGMFGMKDPTMPQLATSTVDAAARLYGLRIALAVRQAFVARGILE